MSYGGLFSYIMLSVMLLQFNVLVWIAFTYMIIKKFEIFQLLALSNWEMISVKHYHLACLMYVAQLAYFTLLNALCLLIK